MGITKAQLQSVVRLTVRIIFGLTLSSLISLPLFAQPTGVSVSSSFTEEAKAIEYTVESDKPFTDFHIRFGAPSWVVSNFKITAQPGGWDAPVITKIGQDILITWKDSDGSNPQNYAIFVVKVTGKVEVVGTTGIDWEVTNDKGGGTPFDGKPAGVLGSKKNDDYLDRFGASYRVVVTVRCRAKSPMEDWRGNNFILAAEGLNADLEAAGDPRRVEVVINQDNINWGDYVTEFVLSYGAGEAPDIWLTGHEYIGVQAEAGRIIALDELMNDFPGFNNVIDNLWDSTSYKGEIWGIPQDAEARPLYFNKALLGELGWTANEIAALPDKIEKGEFTLYDMLAVAKEAVDKGVVADGNGFWTRPKNGPDFTAFYYAFGGDTIDAATGKLVFDEAAGLKYYQFFYDAAQAYGSMGCLGLGWGDAWHPGVSGSKVLFWIGGTWQWAEWAEAYLKDLGGEDYMWETFGFALIPAAEQGGQPNSLTHPLAFLISSQCEHPDLALALIDKVTDYGPNTRHAIASTHLGILKGQTEYKFYKDSRLLSEALYMLAYTTFLPNNPYWGSYSTITYEALAATVGGTFTPQEAVDFVVESLQRELGDNVIIR